jgi:hypothetical protein
MLKKIVLNNQSFYHQLKHNLPADLVKEMAGLDDMAEMVTYSRAWFYASKLDLKRRVDVDAILTFADDNLVYALALTIKFFENKEEYEKCAHLKQIQDMVERLIK